MPAPTPPSDATSAGRALDHLPLLDRECRAFAEALGQADPDAPVPGCPGWTARDLGTHVLGVQRFWTGVVRDRTPGRAERSQLVADPPPVWSELVAAVTAASDELVDALAATPPETPVWTFAAEKTAGFVRRRQSHEILIHRIDAEQTAGLRTPVDPALAADGVDEMIRVLYGDLPEGWTFMPVPGLVMELRATDTGDRWTVAMGDGLAIGPQGSFQRRPRLAALEIEGEPEPWQQPTASLTGTAEALDRWFWHRAEPASGAGPEGAVAGAVDPARDAVVAEGDPDVHAALARLLADGIRQ